MPRWLHIPRKAQGIVKAESWLLRAEQQIIPFSELRFPFLQAQIDWANAVDHGERGAFNYWARGSAKHDWLWNCVYGRARKGGLRFQW
jgi:hypothetical protein